MSRSPISILWLVLYTRGVWCLRMLSLSVPSSVVVGDTVRLTCSFELEGDDTLYSIKWYRNEVEFFRFLPRDKTPALYFPLEGVKVDMRYSANDTVLLQDIDSTTSGRFKCEVSADAPSFQTEAVLAHLKVKDNDDSGTSTPHFSSLLLLLSGLLLLPLL